MSLQHESDYLNELEFSMHKQLFQNVTFLFVSFEVKNITNNKVKANSA